MLVKPLRTIKVFYSYAYEDRSLRDELDKHLNNMKRLNQITGWYDRDIQAGVDRVSEIDVHLNTAQIILLLVSPDFMASDYCYSVEMQRALERHAQGEARVIPVILRHVDWEGAPFSGLQVLPRDARPITSWPDHDEAFWDVTVGIRRAVHDLLYKTKEQWLLEGRNSHTAGHYEKALLAYERAIGLDHTFARAHRSKGDALYHLKQYEEALAAYADSLRFDPASARAHKSRGDILAQLQRNEEALAAYEHAIKLEPGNAVICNDKGNVLYGLKRYDLALTAYEKATNLDPGFAYAYNNTGNALARLKRYPEALIAYEKAALFNPDYAVPHNNRGRVLSLLEKHSDALVAYEQAVRLDPNLISAYDNAAEALERLGRAQEAQSTRARAQQLRKHLHY